MYFIKIIHMLPFTVGHALLWSGSYYLEVTPVIPHPPHTLTSLIFIQIVVIFGNIKEGWCGKMCLSTLQDLVHFLLEVIIELLNSFTMAKKMSNYSMDSVFRTSQIFPLMNCMNLFSLEKMKSVSIEYTCVFKWISVFLWKYILSAE